MYFFVPYFLNKFFTASNPSFFFFKLVPLKSYTVTIYSGNGGGFETTGSSVSFTTNIPVPVVTLGTVSDTTVELSWASDSYATWHRVEYTTGSARAVPVVVAAMQTGNGMTVTKLAPGTTFNFRIYSGTGPSYYEPHGTLVTVTTAASNGESQAGLGGGNLIPFLPFLCQAFANRRSRKVPLPELLSAFWLS